MKVLTIAGTRPELIRLCLIIQKLDQVCDHVLVYTNQNYDPNLSTLFFDELGIRKPDYTLEQHCGVDNFLGFSFIEFGEILTKEKPDKVLVLGDTNSGLLTILAAKKGIPVYHMEAGNRCYDGDVPEETNRRVIDSCSMFNLPYTENSKQNLINERFHKNFVFKIGNPIAEVLYYFMDKINASDITQRIGVIATPFTLLTFHRTENVDNPKRVKKVIAAMKEVAKKMPVIYPLHPRSKDQFEKQGVDLSGITCIEPIGLFDFVKLEKLATIVFTDSGTVPEETSLFGTNTVVLRNTTERQELMENGTLILAGTETESILNAYNFFLKKEMGNEKVKPWEGLEDYDKLNVSDTVVRLLMGQNHKPERMGHDEY
jgi:UDP-N-acetylglucosamine 2-epimerase (non-hydrolysing)